MRHFRASVAVYESIRAELDAAYGYPNADTKTETVLPAAGRLPKDSAGRVYLRVSEEYCQYALPSGLLSQMLASGDIEEVTASQYAAILPPPPF